MLRRGVPSRQFLLEGSAGNLEGCWPTKSDSLPCIEHWILCNSTTFQIQILTTVPCLCGGEGVLWLNPGLNRTSKLPSSELDLWFHSPMCNVGPALIILQNPNDHLWLATTRMQTSQQEGFNSTTSYPVDTLVLVSSPWEGLHAEIEGHFRQQEWRQSDIPTGSFCESFNGTKCL